MNIFDLAELQLRREKKNITDLAIVDKAVHIRKWLNGREKIADKILNGEKYYKYGKHFIFTK